MSTADQGLGASGGGENAEDSKPGAQTHGQPETLARAPPVVSYSPFDFFSAFHEKPDRIEEGLFLGGMGSVSSLEQLESMSISSILTVANGFPPKFPNKFTYTVISVLDSPNVNLSQYFDQCFAAIDEGREKGGIVVHCMAGVSRSVTVVVAYIMRLHQINLQKAMAYVKRCRPIACPNYGFMRQLQEYEAKLLADKQT